MGNSPEEDERFLAGIKQMPSRLNPKPIGSVMRKLMTQRGYGQTAANEALDEQWKLAVGEELAACTRPGNVSRGILRVHTSNPVAAQEIQFMKRKILQRMNKELPDMNIKDVRIVS